MARHRPSRLSPLLGLALAAILASPALATQEAAPSPTPDDQQGWGDLDSFGEQISVDVVNLDVWVTDASGDPVTGLDRDAFRISVDGKPVEVTNFSAFEGTSGLTPERGRSGDGTPWEIAPETRLQVDEGEATLELQTLPPEERLYLTVLVDDWALRPEDRARVFEDLRGFLGDVVGTGDQVAVAVHDQGLQMAQGFTDDPAKLAAALDRVEHVAPAGVRLVQERRSALQEMQQTMQAAEETAARAQEDACTLAIGGLQGIAQRYASSAQGHVQASASAIATTAQVLSGVPGRKVVLYVGNGLAQTAGLLMFEYVSELCPQYRSQLGAYQQQYDMSWLYEEVAARANAARVTIYTLESQSAAIDLGLDRATGGETGRTGKVVIGEDPSQGADVRGGGAFALSQSLKDRGGAGAGRRFTPSTAVQRLEQQDEESSLTLIAGQTGGRAFLNASDFRNDFQRLASDLRTYYSLGFRPVEEGDGQLQRVEVKLRDGVRDGKGYRVRHRLRYRAETLAERMASRVRGVAQFGTESNPLEARIETGEAFPTADGRFRVPIRVWVPLDRMTLIDSGGGKRQGKLLVLMATTDAKGNLLPVRQKEIEVQVGAGADPSGEAGGTGAARREHLVEIELLQAAGSHHVALGVRDELGGETSYLREQFRVPGTQVATNPEEEER